MRAKILAFLLVPLMVMTYFIAWGMGSASAAQLPDPTGQPNTTARATCRMWVSSPYQTTFTSNGTVSYDQLTQFRCAYAAIPAPYLQVFFRQYVRRISDGAIQQRGGSTGSSSLTSGATPTTDNCPTAAGYSVQYPAYKDFYNSSQLRYGGSFCAQVGVGSATDAFAFDHMAVLYGNSNGSSPEYPVTINGSVVDTTNQIGTDNSVWPTDWYPGGGAVLSGPPAPTVTCSRTLSDPSTGTANFAGTISGGGIGSTISQSWAFGDGNTSTTLSPSHRYNYSTQPDNGWTAILTVTATGDGTHYTTDSTQATCSLRVDFANPSATVAGSIDSGQADDSDCPSGWGWLNPASLGNLLRCLFIPSSDGVSSITSLWGDVSTRAPFSWVVEVTQFIPDTLQHFGDGLTDGQAIPCNTQTVVSAAHPYGGGSLVIGPYSSVDIHDSFCTQPGGGLYDVRTYVGWCRDFLTALFLIALAFGVYNTVEWAIS